MSGITDEQIEALRSEAASAGDMKQVSICDQALRDGPYSDAWSECLRVRNDAAAMVPDGKKDAR